MGAKAAAPAEPLAVVIAANPPEDAHPVLLHMEAEEAPPADPAAPPIEPQQVEQGNEDVREEEW